jgi:hypothetical protein
VLKIKIQKALETNIDPMLYTIQSILTNIKDKVKAKTTTYYVPLYCTFTMSVAITNKFYTFHNWTLTNSSTESILHINKYYMHTLNRPKIPENQNSERERERENQHYRKYLACSDVSSLILPTATIVLQALICLYV